MTYGTISTQRTTCSNLANNRLDGEDVEKEKYKLVEIESANLS